jgi:dihydropteroate synthase
LENLFRPFTLNLRGTPTRFDKPAIMGIVNVTPDSFFAGSRTTSTDDISRRVKSMVDDGVDIIDLGAYSSRPGADDVSPAEEINRLALGMKVIRDIAPSMPVSIDTFRADVAEAAISDLGADIINDISGGDLDAKMFDTVARLNVPYILMHMRGTPTTMQSLTDYDADGGVTNAVITTLKRAIDRLTQLGVSDIIVDPGFGFAKTVEQNYTLLADLPMFALLGRPTLVGISRKSMFYKPLHSTPEKSLNATTAANVIALLGGASILRVHDVAEACEARKIVELTLSNKSI